MGGKRCDSTPTHIYYCSKGGGGPHSLLLKEEKKGGLFILLSCIVETDFILIDRYALALAVAKDQKGARLPLSSP